MSGKGKTEGNGGRGTSGSSKKSQSTKAGLQFPVGRISRYLKKGNYASRIGHGAPVYLAAVLEYLTAEIIELAGNAARDNSKIRIIPRHIFLAVFNDMELNAVFRGVTFAQSGVIPNIDIGIPQYKSNFPKSKFLENDHKSNDDINAFIISLSGKVDARVKYSDAPNIIKEDEIVSLIKLVDTSHSTANAPIHGDFKYYMTKEELQKILCGDTMQRLLSEWASESKEWNEVIIRRFSATGMCINMHIDHAFRTMQIALNNDTDYEGGRLTYAANGKLFTHNRLAGSITVHDNTIVHGVTELVSGIRYGLFFLNKAEIA